ncbi:MAG: hypothetical protein PHS86_04145 [Syntrophaceae bacterium]|nr:hypothetical protein [Syntrophaceae bacterium]
MDGRSVLMFSVKARVVVAVVIYQPVMSASTFQKPVWVLVKNGDTARIVMEKFSNKPKKTSMV